MKYENYTVSRYDRRNLKVVKEIEKVAERDILLGDGTVKTKKGDRYMGTVELGYAQTAIAALNLIVNDKSLNAMESETLALALGKIKNAVESVKNELMGKIETL